MEVVPVPLCSHHDLALGARAFTVVTSAAWKSSRRTNYILDLRCALCRYCVLSPTGSISVSGVEMQLSGG